MAGIGPPTTNEPTRNLAQKAWSAIKKAPFVFDGKLLTTTVDATSERELSHGLGRTPKGAAVLHIESDASLTGGQVCVLSKDDKVLKIDNPHSSDVSLIILVW